LLEWNIQVETKFYNNIVQLGTGEGKSLVLAVLAIIFGMFNFSVDIVCYSNYLINRDKIQF